MKYIIFSFVILIMLCCPFPLKISFIFKESKFKFKIYNFFINKKLNNSTNIKSNKNKNFKEKEKNKSKRFINSINKNAFVINYITENYFKKRKMYFKRFNKRIKCTITFNIIYGFENPCYTALLYPGIITILSELQIYSLKCLKYKKVKSNISPDFNNKILNLVFSGIFYVSLGRIIHISFLRLKALKIYKLRGEANVPSN